jgi:hypothetical protein
MICLLKEQVIFPATEAEAHRKSPLARGGWFEIYK